MNPDAARELMDLIMLDDFVERRAALDVWSRRWLATMHVEHDGSHEKAQLELLSRVVKGLVADEAKVLRWGLRLDTNMIQLEINFVRRVPLEGV